MKKMISLFAFVLVVLAGCSTAPEAYAGVNEQTDDKGLLTVTTVEYAMQDQDITACSFNATFDDKDLRNTDSSQPTWAADADLICQLIVENDSFPETQVNSQNSNLELVDDSQSVTINLEPLSIAFANAEKIQ